MKTLLLIFLVYTLQNLVLSKNGSLQKSPILVRTFPKKTSSVLLPNLKILNRRYIQTYETSPESLGVSKKTKKEWKLKEYTVFPPHLDETVKKIGIPDSPYFPDMINIEQKHRVKKVLPDYLWSSRKKRATGDKKDNIIKIKGDKKDKSKKDVTPSKKDAKVEKKPEKKPKNDEKLQEKKVLKREAKDLKQGSVKSKPELHGKTSRSKGIHDIGRKRKNKLKSKILTFGRIGAEKRKRLARTGNKTQAQRKGKKYARNGTKLTPGNKKSAVKKQAEASRRLTAGMDALIEDYPYVVSIQKDGEHWCAGSLLNPRLVITTANCVWKANRVSRMRIRAGSRYAGHGGQVVKIQEVLKHPEWNIRRNPDNDVALLLLDKNIRFGHGVHGVDLPNRAMMPVFDDAWITSWGSERRDGIFEKRPMTLQVYHARLMDRAKCNNVTMRFGVKVSENFICLAQSGKRAPCTRDTGAPAVSDGVLWGMASWGIRKLCGTERFPAMFSYVGSHSNMDFITNATSYLMAEERHSPFLARFHFEHTITTTESRK